MRPHNRLILPFEGKDGTQKIIISCYLQFKYFIQFNLGRNAQLFFLFNTSHLLIRVIFILDLTKPDFVHPWRFNVFLDKKDKHHLATACVQASSETLFSSSKIRWKMCHNFYTWRRTYSIWNFVLISIILQRLLLGINRFYLCMNK